MSGLSEDRLVKALEQQFNQHRIIVWYDKESKLREFFDQVDIPGVTKLEINNNEFTLKYRILREEPDKQFLLFKEGSKPENTDNWLLDVELAYTEFKAEQGSIWLNDLGLGTEFLGIVTGHPLFFESRQRRESLKTIIDKNETESGIKLKMISICAGTKPDLYEIVESLITDVADDNVAPYRLIAKCALEVFFWKEIERRFNYKSDNPSVKDFTIQLFETSFGFAITEDKHKKLSQETLIFLQRWQSSLAYHKSYNTLSSMSDEILNIRNEIPKLKSDLVINIESFQSVEAYVSSELLQSVSNRTITLRDCDDIISRRRGCYWYKDYENRYSAARESIAFFQSINDVNLTIDSFECGVNKYSATWFEVDRHYRNALHSLNSAGEDVTVKKLIDDVQKAYLNKYLIKLNDSWQKAVESHDFNSSPVMKQNSFYNKKVNPFLENQKKVAVIISDALRYEAGVELMDAIRREDKFEATIEPMIAMLPSYTQLGMAALLPHKKLHIDEKANAFADDKPTSGIQNRNSILGSSTNNKALALKSEDFMTMGRDEIRDNKREYDVLYIYHNRIDSVGDKRDTEERVIESVNDAITDILVLLRKLASADYYNMIVTADHGFLYQNQPVEDTDYIELGKEWSDAPVWNRRFVIGKKLPDHPGMMKRKSSELGLDGELDISFPKSINRLRLAGSGSRYVHGGVTLQEMIIPIVSVNKKRRSDISYVDVDIMQRGSDKITTGQIAVYFYQLDPVSEKVHPRNVIAGIYTKDDILLSQQEELIFDISSAESQDREKRTSFRLTADISDMNNQEVLVKLKEKEEDTSYYRDYKTRSLFLQVRQTDRDF